jgi:glycosyltransferase involved in cell wall biosynthesis
MNQPGGLHVLYVIDSVMTPGGAEQSLALLAPEYRRLGIRLDVATIHKRPGHQEALLAAGAQLFSVGGRGGGAAHVARCRALIRDLRPDVVHTTLYEADVVGRLAAWTARTPVVSSLVNVAYGPEHFADPSAGTWRLRAAQAIDAVTASRAVRMHAVSERVAELMAPRLHYPRDRIDVVVRGRSPEALGVRTDARRGAARAGLGLQSGERVVLSVAREEHQKGLDVLLEALPAVVQAEPHARLFIAARRGAQSDELRQIVDRLDLARFVTFLGTRADIPELLCAADVFVLPSRREGLPGAVLEAMALEAPVVASDLPEVREVVGREQAVLVPPESPERLADAVLEVLQDSADVHARVASARDRFLDVFTVTTVARQMRNFYDRALA